MYSHSPLWVTRYNEVTTKLVPLPDDCYDFKTNSPSISGRRYADDRQDVANETDDCHNSQNESSCRRRVRENWCMLQTLHIAPVSSLT